MPKVNLRLQLIASDPLSRSLEYLNYLIFMFVLLISIAVYNYELSFIAIAILLMQLIGRRWSGDAGLDIVDQSIPQKKKDNLVLAVGLAFLSYVMVDAAVYPIVGLAGSVTSFFGGLIQLSTLPSQAVLPLGVLIGVQAGISEPVFFVQAVTNYFAARGVSGRFGVAGGLAGIIMSGVVFGLGHVPTDGFTIAIITLSLAGVITAFAAMLVGLLIVAMAPHILNNLTALGLLLVLPHSLGGMAAGIIFPSGLGTLLFIGLATNWKLSVFTAALLARRRPAGFVTEHGKRHPVYSSQRNYVSTADRAADRLDQALKEQAERNRIREGLPPESEEEFLHRFHQQVIVKPETPAEEAMAEELRKKGDLRLKHYPRTYVPGYGTVERPTYAYVLTVQGSKRAKKIDEKYNLEEAETKDEMRQGLRTWRRENR